MAVLTATFETGVDEAIIATGDAGSATPWDLVLNNPQYDSAHAYGNLSMRTDQASEYCVWSTALGTVTDYYGRVYFYITGNPALAHQIVRIYNGVSLAATAVFINSSGQLVIGSSNAGLGNTTASVGLNQWVRAEFHVIHSLTVGFVEVKLFNDPDSVIPTEVLTSDADNNTLANADSVRIGRDAGDSAGTVWIDNVVFNADAYPGPFALPVGPTEPEVLSMLPHVSGHSVW